MMTSLPLGSALTSRGGVLAGRLVPIALLLLAIPSRLLNLEAFAGKFDEGIRGTQLMLMAAGFRPFRDIFASQGPLSLDVFYPTYALFGQTLGAARLAPALFSIVGVVLAAWTARHAGGLVAGAVAGLLLTLSPIFLKNSRLALVEVPALVPAIGAVGAALAYGSSGDRRWLVGAGVLMALALAIKPIVAPALLPIGLAILVRGRGWLLQSGWVWAGPLSHHPHDWGQTAGFGTGFLPFGTKRQVRGRAKPSTGRRSGTPGVPRGSGRSRTARTRGSSTSTTSPITGPSPASRRATTSATPASRSGPTSRRSWRGTASSWTVGGS